jgi:hypothetical protein
MSALVTTDFYVVSDSLPDARVEVIKRVEVGQKAIILNI